MTGYIHKQPADYLHPYKQMLNDFYGQIKEYSKRRGIEPNYIVINTEDRDNLLDEMISAKLIGPGHSSGKLQFRGIRIIESQDIIKGFFEVLGN